MVRNRDLAVVVLLTFCVTASLFTIVTTRGQGGDYDPWLDINDDGYIGVDDIYTVATHFGIEGTPVVKGSIEYDSGWMNVTDKAGQDIVVTHGLNSTDLIADIQGKTRLNEGPHQKAFGGSEWVYEPGVDFGGISVEEAYALVQTADGGYAIAGYTYSYGAGSADFWLVKTDANGNAQWNKTYGGTGNDRAYALVQTVDGGCALAGYTDSFGAGSSDFWLVKTDAAGNLQWNKTYGGTSDDEAYALVQTVDGGYTLAGYTRSYGASSNDFWLVKTDAFGNVQWNKTYGGTSDDEARALVETVDGGCALAGWTSSFGAGSYDFWLVKTDPNGNSRFAEEWFKWGMEWTSSTLDTITLRRGTRDSYWNYVRVHIWKPKQTP